MAVRESTKPAEYAPEPATQRNRVRDAAQLDIDERTRKLVAAWDAAGHPDGNAGPNTRFDADDKTEAKRMVARAFSLISKERRTATPPVEPNNLRAYWYRDSEPDSEGWITIQYGVSLTQSSATQTAQEAAENPSEESGTADQENPDESGSGRFRRR
jgi:hypothetical protein